MSAQQATSKCISALAESSWLRHQTQYHCNFATDEKDRFFLTAQYLEKVAQNQSFDTAARAKWGQPLWCATQTEQARLPVTWELESDTMWTLHVVSVLFFYKRKEIMVHSANSVYCDTECCRAVLHCLAVLHHSQNHLEKAQYIITALRFMYFVWIRRSVSLKPVFEVVVWTAVSHGFLPARSRGICRSLLEHRKHWCVLSHMPHMSLWRC